MANRITLGLRSLTADPDECSGQAAAPVNPPFYTAQIKPGRGQRLGLSSWRAVAQRKRERRTGITDFSTRRISTPVSSPGYLDSFFGHGGDYELTAVRHERRA